MTDKIDLIISLALNVLLVVRGALRHFGKRRKEETDDSEV
jgi:hypothetical protein